MLESFRLFLNPQNEWMTEAKLLADLRGEFHPTPEMMLGTAFGRAIEKPDRWRLPDKSFKVPVKGDRGWVEFRFTAAMVDQALMMLDRRGVFEVRSEREYDGWIVIAKLDQIIGTRINENKTTTKYFDFEKYAESCQWRFYLDIFGASAITYNVFEIREPALGEYALGDVSSFNLFPYAEMHQDCLDLVREFKAYVALRGLETLLQDRAEQMAKYTAGATL
jgi:hypothetical protein